MIMSKILYDWQCTSCDLIFEGLAPSAVTELECPVCQAIAKRTLVSAPRIDRLGMGATKNASPESIDYFERVHKQQRTIEESCLANHGDYGPRPGSD